MNTLQLKSQHGGDYKTLETGGLGSDLLRMSSSAIRNPEDKLREIETSNLIFVFSEFSY